MHLESVLIFSVAFKALSLQPRKQKNRTSHLLAFVLAGTVLSRPNQLHQPINPTRMTTTHSMEAWLVTMNMMRWSGQSLWMTKGQNEVQAITCVFLQYQSALDKSWEHVSVIVHKDRSGGIHCSHATWSPWWKREKMETWTPSKGDVRHITNQLVPLVKSLAGALSPWEGLSKEQVQELLDKIYGFEKYIVQDAPIDPWGPFVSHTFINCLVPC